MSILRIKELEQAIINHRDQKGDDRCWLDDKELYSVLNEPIPDTAGILPSKEVFLGNCERYYQCRKKSEIADQSSLQGQLVMREELELMEMRIRDKIASLLRKEAAKLLSLGKMNEVDILNKLGKKISSPVVLEELLNDQ